MLVREITHITAHDWYVVHGYKRFVAA